MWGWVREGESRKKQRSEWVREGGGWSRQQRLQQWRQRPESSMPNPGSHFLLHRRLLWNSSSVANVTMRTRDSGRRERSGPLLSMHLPSSLSLFLLHPIPLPSAVFVRLTRAKTTRNACATTFSSVMYVGSICYTFRDSVVCTVIGNSLFLSAGPSTCIACKVAMHLCETLIAKALTVSHTFTRPKC